MNSYALVGCAFAILFWGTAGIFDKLAIKGADPFGAVLVRMVFVTAAVLVFCLATGRTRAALQFSPQTYLYLAGSGLAGGLVGQLAYFMALKHAPVTLVVPITATYPVVAFLLAVLFLREQPTPAKMAGVVLVVVGLMLVSGGKPAKSPEAEPATAAATEAGSSQPPVASLPAPPPAPDPAAGE